MREITDSLLNRNLRKQGYAQYFLSYPSFSERLWSMVPVQKWQNKWIISSRISPIYLNLMKIIYRGMLGAKNEAKRNSKIMKKIERIQVKLEENGKESRRLLQAPMTSVQTRDNQWILEVLKRTTSAFQIASQSGSVADVQYVAHQVEDEFEGGPYPNVVNLIAY
ncbi:hypothetical protein VNO77_07700 [Canavalia gladiata]|uniref:Uncharacterized protein n=1 Tax=Canavalia gladiata TaxID=3824 RepID=A0AAN9M7U3_CANGL